MIAEKRANLAFFFLSFEDIFSRFMTLMHIGI